MVSWNHRLAAALLIAAGLAGRADADLLSGTCDVRFEATSTLHDFAGTARCRPFTAAVAAGAAGRRTVPVVEAEVPVDGMDTRNGARDRQMRTMFDGARYPTIRATVRGIDPERLRRELRGAPGGRVVVELVLRIRDVERPVRAVARRLSESAGAADFELEFPVSLKEFGLSPPTVLGFIRVGDRVLVTATVRVTGVPAD